jgi:hypothetical protein
MGKGLSPLQKNILAVLEEFPALEDILAGNYWQANEDHPADYEHSIDAWARPRQILKRLGLEPTASNRAAISKSLLRLYRRGKIAAVSLIFPEQGQSRFYLRITDPANAGWTNADSWEGMAPMNTRMTPQMLSGRLNVIRTRVLEGKLQLIRRARRSALLWLSSD